LETSATFQDRNDAALLHLGRAGNEEAFLELYHRHLPAVFRFAQHMSGSREMAEEVAQEVFLALLADGTTYEAERGTLEAFLIGITRNHVRRRIRQDRKSAIGQVTDYAQDHIDTISIESDLKALRKAILALPESYRAVTVLCDLEQLSYADAAQRLGCAIGTVRSRLHRARAILETKLRRREQCRATTTR
jgi:RNA polymerase sigma-70 factor (ECF subfamily)